MTHLRGSARPAFLQACAPPRRGVRRRSGGFTLIEVLMVMVIAAILLSLAAPNFVPIIRGNRLTNQINQLSFSMNLARSEAVKRGIPVTVCKSSNSADCGTSGVNWENGWVVFLDIDRDQAYDPGDGEVIVQINQALLDGYTLRGSTNVADAVTFDASGYSLAQGTLVLCAENRIDYARSLGVTLAGRIRRGADSDADGIPETLGGTEITSCTSP